MVPVLAGSGWLRIGVLLVCALSSGKAYANCVLVALGGSMSLMSCSGGVKGPVYDLGNGLASYRLSNGVFGLLNLAGAATVPAPSTAGATVSFLINGVNGTPKAGATTGPTGTPRAATGTAGPGVAVTAPLTAPLNAPLALPMATVARPVPVTPPGATGPAPPTTGNAQ